MENIKSLKIIKNAKKTSDNVKSSIPFLLSRKEQKDILGGCGTLTTCPVTETGKSVCIEYIVSCGAPDKRLHCGVHSWYACTLLESGL